MLRGSVSLKWKVGFNTEVAEGTEKRRKELRLDRVDGGAYKHERAKDETRMFEPSTPGKYLSWEPLEHVYAA